MSKMSVSLSKERTFTIIIQKILEAHTQNDEYENFVTTPMEAAA